MNFTKTRIFISNNNQTILLLLGLLCIVLAITFLTNIFYGLLALGIIFVLLAFMIFYEKGG